MRQKVIDGVLHIEVHEPPAGLNIDVPMGTRAVDCLSGAYWQRVPHGQWWLVGTGDPHIFKEVCEVATPEPEAPHRVPTLEEVLAAGYGAPSAHGIVAREQALADGLTSEAAWEASEQAVAAYLAANSPPPPEEPLVPAEPDGNGPIIEPTDVGTPTDAPVANTADVGTPASTPALVPEGDGPVIEPAADAVEKKGWLSGVLGGKSDAPSGSKSKKRRGG